MANAERASRVKHTHETNALSYGHFGTATYHADTHDWTFLRKVQAGHRDREDDGDDDSDQDEYHLIHESVWRQQQNSANDHVTVRDHAALHAGNNNNLLLKHVPETAAASSEVAALKPVIGALTHGEAAEGLTQDECVAQRFTRQLTEAHEIDDQLYAEAAAAFGARGIVDLIVLAGCYDTVSSLLNAFRVPVPK